MIVSKNRGTPKWMVKKMENLIKMDDLGVPPFLETSRLPGNFYDVFFDVAAEYLLVHILRFAGISFGPHGLGRGFAKQTPKVHI